MDSKQMKNFFMFFMLAAVFTALAAQDKVPTGINYQAVARYSNGDELQNEYINVKFSIIAGDPLSTPVFEELHSHVSTTQFGVFNLIVGTGVSTGKAICSDISQISWEKDVHWLKVEVQFPRENEFRDMGTLQFYSVPYALYAQRSLEPGPAGPRGDPGPKGDPGDPASDNQTLSVVNVDGSDYLAISGGNQVKISTIEKDGDPTNEIQDLIVSSDKLKITRNQNATEWDLTKYLDNTDNQSLTWNAGSRLLGISGSTTTIDLTELKNDADADPSNELQTLSLAGDLLSISGKNSVNLAAFKDNTDNQTLTYSEAGKSLSISGGNSVTLDNMVAFRAKKTNTTSAALPMSTVDFIPNDIEYNDGGDLNLSNGTFTAPVTGLYSFDIKYVAPSSGDGRILMFYKNGNNYETFASGISVNSTIYRNITIKLNSSDNVKVVVYTGLGTEIGTGYFSGHKVY